ncbi:MAG TPA: ATP-binding protein [Candidatus Binatia bacterium]|nr:ATP-binding protein [Candidatus Binatia bacterium]
MDTSWWLLIAQYAAQVRQLEAALQEKEALVQHQAQLMSQSEEKLRKHGVDVERQLLASGHLVPLRELTASMAHELNNPLGIILGFAQERLNDIDPSDPSYRTLQIINEEATRCEMVVRDLMEFARPRTPEFASTDVKEVIAKTFDLLARRLQHDQIEARDDTDAVLPMLDADPQLLQQVLVNLCSNSLDAMSPGGILSVAVKLERTDTLSIVVADTGFGIDRQSLGKIFQPFFSAKKRRGLGLGLPICDRIVKAHGGSIEVKSRPGEGTRVFIHLPLRRGV